MAPLERPSPMSATCGTTDHSCTRIVRLLGVTCAVVAYARGSAPRAHCHRRHVSLVLTYGVTVCTCTDCVCVCS